MPSIAQNYRVRELSVQSPLLKGNTLCQRMSSDVSAGLDLSAKFLKPDIYMPKAMFASTCLTGRDAVNFLKLIAADDLLCSLTDVDQSALVIPGAGQRFPTRDRIKGIRSAWVDKSRTDDWKVETIDIGLFGAVVSTKGIQLGTALFVVFDGLGRIAAALDELNEDDAIASHTWVEKNFIIQLNIDLSGNVRRHIRNFLARNRDAKRLTKGSILAAESGLIDTNGHESVPSDIANPLARTWVIKELYKLGTENSVLQLLPWEMEGHKANNIGFGGKGKASSLSTALQDLVPEIRRAEISVEELPAALSFGLKQFWSICPESRAAAQNKGLFYPDGATKCRFSSTLAVKAMLLLTLRVFPYTGEDGPEFRELVAQILGRNLKDYRENYVNSKRNKLTPDLFFRENRYFADRMFNSGASNAQIILKRLSDSAERVIGE